MLIASDFAWNYLTIAGIPLFIGCTSRFYEKTLMEQDLIDPSIDKPRGVFNQRAFKNAFTVTGIPTTKKP
ncbi:MAG: hypothetical protein ACYYK0_02760 [Candidatus Eutrophobiaceae bacterium]